MTTPPHIVVLGAGYTGLTAANLLAKRTGATVTLVNNRDRFVERLRNHQLASGQQLRTLPLRDLVRRTGVRLVVDHVTRIDPEQRRVELTGGEPIGYDLLVYAAGSHEDLDTVPGAAEHATAVATAEEAERLRGRMRTASAVAVVGGGLTGIEAATELAETYPDRRVRLTTSGVLGSTLLERGQEHLYRTFDRLGIEVREHAQVAKVAADGLLLENGEHIDADVVVWTTGFRVPRLAREAGLAVADNGRILVDGTMRSVSHPEVYAIGDAASARKPDGQEVRMGCGPGGFTTACAVRAIEDRLAGRTPRELRLEFDGQCISLGRKDGVVQYTNADGGLIGPMLTGRTAAMFKEAIVRGAGGVGLRHPTLALVTASRSLV
ncbi:NADH dehydrogenase FAD-containing subunit [Pseudonocardia hierapolitana]|uniref:NADH dehydrogenase FAD-containing subunit n=1 Tax=Pseudonocardia hierapolitana TaxID=1128676 RepID=A0A561SVR9_9PSEU|nr:FAD-dependent oxidoreductase [Pseudonocardia hierapolitana]TWF78945.1 NADH dehydrogenase FAD-containing subunit [Pseudonocardia hierapolitana]